MILFILNRVIIKLKYISNKKSVECQNNANTVYNFLICRGLLFIISNIEILKRICKKAILIFDLFKENSMLVLIKCDLRFMKEMIKQKVLPISLHY